MAAYAPPASGRGERNNAATNSPRLTWEQIPSAAVAILYSCLNAATTRRFGLRFSR
jgi:hypothetical protein